MAKKKSKKAKADEPKKARHGKVDDKSVAKKKSAAKGPGKKGSGKQKGTTKPKSTGKAAAETVSQPVIDYPTVTPVQNPSQEPVAAPLSDFGASQTPVVADTLMPAEGLTASPMGTSEPLLAYAEPEPEPLPEFSVPDGWHIDLDFELPLLIFTLGDIELFTVPLTENFLEDLLPRLNQLQLSQTEAATSWEIRLPEDLKNNPPVFSMMKNGAVAASIPLSNEVIEDLMPALERFDTREEKQPEKTWVRLRRWVKKHKIRAALALLLIVPITGYILFAIGMQVFFTPS